MTIVKTALEIHLEEALKEQDMKQALVRVILF